MTKTGDPRLNMGEKTTGNRSFDAFVSYRRLDGTAVATWLRNQIRRYRLPKALREKYLSREGGLRVWLDTIQKFADDDYFESQIGPAIRDSRCLIVVSTPTVYEHAADDQGEQIPNWVDREIDVFRVKNVHGPIIIAQAHPADFPGPVPVRVKDLPHLSQIDVRPIFTTAIDLKGRIGEWLNRWRMRTTLREEVLDCIAALYQIKPDDMTILRQEDARRRQRVKLAAVAGFLVIIGVLIGIYAVSVPIARERLEQRATQNWLEGDSSAASSALKWFRDRQDRDEVLIHWATIAAGQDEFSQQQRGRAAQILWHLLERGEFAKRRLSELFRRLGSNGQAGLTPNTWHTTFSNLNAANTQLKGSDLSWLAFAGNDFRQTDLSSSLFPAGFFNKCQLQGADFRWCDFAKASFIGVSGKTSLSFSSIHETTFSDCDFSHCDFYGCDLSGAQFLSCKLDGANFTNAFLTGATFENCKMRGTVFVNPDVKILVSWGRLASVQWSNCTLSDVSFNDASFIGETQSFYERDCASPSNYSQYAPIYPRASQGSNTIASGPAQLIIPSALFIDCKFENVSWNGAIAKPDCFDEASWSQLPEPIRNGMGSATSHDEGTEPISADMVESAKAERSWESIKSMLSLMFSASRGLQQHP